jgi:transposase-like protein
MKCPICNKTEMERVKDVVEQDGIEFEAFKCASCGEEIMDMKQLGTLASKYRKLRKAKEITFAKWGNSIAVRIPSDLAKEYHIEAGKSGILTKDKEGIKIISA